MPRPDLVERLAAIGDRGACTDAERRASALLRDDLRARGRPARLETAWVRPQWPLAWALHAALAVASSLLAVEVPVAGLAVLVLLALSWALDISGRAQPLRLVFPRRATQVVVAEPPPRRGPPRIRLVLAAQVDAPRMGAIFKPAYRPLRRVGPAVLLACTLALAGLAAARVAGAEGQTLGVAQLVPTVLLLLALGALLDVALSDPSPGANADASAVQAAMAVAEALDRAPPRALDVELVLAGAGDGPGAGMRAYVRRRRKQWAAEDVAVLAFGACGAGEPRFHLSEGLLIGARLHPRLIELARAAAAAEPALHAAPLKRALSPAHPARQARWPTLGLSARDARGAVPRARRPEDTADRVDRDCVGDTVDLALAIIHRLDIDLSPAATLSAVR